MKAFRTFMAVLALFLTVSGCGTQKKAIQKAERLRSEGQSAPAGEKDKISRKKILYPLDHDSINSYYSDNDEGYGQIIKIRPASNRPEIKFNMLESSNVRVVGINPLPEDGVLELDLDNMKSEFCYPYKGEFLSDYGKRGRAMHTGVDIRTVSNDTIRAAFPGVVRMSKMYSSYGNIVVIRHYEGFETLYAHSSRNLVNVNDVVEAGDPITLGGRTGRATTEHLHFEVRVAGEPVDPNKLLDIPNQTLRRGKMYVGLVDGKIIAYNSQADLRKTEEEMKSLETARVESESKAAEIRSVAAAESEKTAESSSEYYKVKKGDTLYGIAVRHKTTVKKLCELNSIKETTPLQINQRLRVK